MTVVPLKSMSPLDEIGAEVVEAETGIKRSLIQHAMSQGSLLAQARKLLPGDKEFGEWMRTDKLSDCMTQKQAHRYRTLFEAFGHLPIEIAEKIGLSNGYALADKTPDEQERVAAAAQAAGARLSAKQVKALLDPAPEPEPTPEPAQPPKPDPVSDQDPEPTPTPAPKPTRAAAIAEAIVYVDVAASGYDDPDLQGEAEALIDVLEDLRDEIDSADTDIITARQFRILKAGFEIDASVETRAEAFEIFSALESKLRPARELP